MDIFSLLGLIGGLAFFLFGMNIMGESLEKTSGGRLEKTLERMTDSTIKGLLLGAGVTAVIQSSSATTVMVVGFVNSGIMKLRQAIGIIMGANIGTTVTSWILSLTGIDGDSIIIQLLKPSGFSPVLGIAGVVLVMFCKSSKKTNIGMVLVGFSLILTGMDTMSAAVKPLADVPEFTRLLTMFNNPLFGILAGALLTAIIQSSSASVGILQALSGTGSITCGMAIPIVMGQNIGTCVTAIISCIGANKNAKRAAAVHLYFNIIGSLVWCTVFYTLNYFLKFPFTQSIIGPGEIAVIHTAFNLLSTLLLLPFSKQLEKLALLTIRDGSERSNDPYIDERFLDTPAIAAERCRDMAFEMAKLTADNFIRSMSLLDKYDGKIHEEIRKNELLTDKYEDVLGSYLVKLCSRSLSGRDSREVSKLLLCIGDWERISDHSLNIANSAMEMHQKKISFSQTAFKELKVVRDALTEVIENTVRAFTEDNCALAEKVEPLEQVIDKLIGNLRGRHIKRLKEGACTVELGFIHSDLITSFSRASDHCSNIAVCVIQIEAKAFETHEYLNKIKENDGEFRHDYLRYKDKYILPEIS